MQAGEIAELIQDQTQSFPAVKVSRSTFKSICIISLYKASLWGQPWKLIQVQAEIELILKFSCAHVHK